VFCPGVSRWFVEVCLCKALSCKAFLLKKKKKIALALVFSKSPASVQRGNRWGSTDPCISGGVFS
jgi:hypothetical protein